GANHSRIYSRSINDDATSYVPKTSIVSCCTKLSISVTSVNGLRVYAIKCNGGSSGINHINSTSHLSSRVTIGIRDIVSYHISSSHSCIDGRSINDDATSYVSKTSIVSCCTKFSISV